jgi:hypothetical protein
MKDAETAQSKAKQPDFAFAAQDSGLFPRIFAVRHGFCG